jgi:hypothetical protein
MRDPDGHVNAWCDTCEALLALNGGAWNHEAEAFAGIKLICEDCFDGLKQFCQTREVH